MTYKQSLNYNYFEVCRLLAFILLYQIYVIIEVGAVIKTNIKPSENTYIKKLEYIIGGKYNMYTKFFKRLIDFILSFIGLIVLSWLFLIIIIAIKIDSPGPVFFKQKRVGIHKKYFYIHKFRTMRIDTPKDTPTHMLANPESYITKVGAFLRKTSLDELPQFWDVFVGNMSIVGPRPALWNQDDLIALRDKYGANDVVPGITGWAQINGRDELEIEEKAKLDGEYVKNLSFTFDLKCFLGTIKSVLKQEGVVEGGTGKKKKGK